MGANQQILSGFIGGAFNPSRLSGLSLWMDPAQNVTLDGSSRVSQLIERSPNALVFSQAIAGNRPDIHASAINGLPAIRADSTARWLTSTTTPTITDYTLFAVMVESSLTQNSWLTKGTDTQLQELFWFWGNGLLAGSSFDNLGTAQHFTQAVTSTLASGYTTYQTIAITKSGMHVDAYKNGAKLPKTSGSNAAYVSQLNAAWVLLGRPTSGTTITGSTNMEIAELIVYNRRLSLAELAQVDDYLERKFAIATTFAPTNVNLPGIVFIGDSLSSGVGSVAPSKRTMDDATVGINRSGQKYDYANHGQASRTMNQALANINTELIPYLTNGDVVVVWMGTNDIVEPRTSAQLIADIDAYFLALRNTGLDLRLIMTTVMNRASFTTAGRGSADGADTGVQLAVNTSIRAMVGLGAVHAVYDVQAEVNLQTTSTAPNTYFQTSGTHITTTGANIVSDGHKTTIEGLYAAASVVTPPATQSITAGQPVTFSVVATAMPYPITYQWKKGGVNISGQTSSSYTIAAVVGGDAASYTVTVTNSVGSATSSDAVLTVI